VGQIRLETSRPGKCVSTRTASIATGIEPYSAQIGGSRSFSSRRASTAAYWLVSGSRR